jgi:hypothetical protein
MDTAHQLIPLPRSLVSAPGRWRTPASWLVAAGEADGRVQRAAIRWLGRIRLVSGDAHAHLRLRRGPVTGLPTGMEPELAAEAYQLRIAADGVVITATADVGLFRGLTTLAQLLTLEPRSLACATITDWPGLAVRNSHLTLGNGFQPPFARLKEFVAQLAWFKVSSFTIEYDDAFSWEKYPFLARPSALTKPQARELAEWAEEHFVEVVPLLDSLGHQDHILHHPQLAHLRELPDNPAELCPSNPAGLEFIKDLWSEVLEIHPRARWVNITGDECFRLGRFCPRCGARAAKGELAQLYCEHYLPLVRWMLERGHRPMLWHDMLAKHPDSLQGFPREAALIYWNYWGVDRDAHQVALGSHGYVWPGEIAREPQPYRELMERWWVHPTQAGAFRPWAELYALKERGFTMLAASGGSCMERAFPFPGFRGRIDNPRSLARTLADMGGTGLVHTFWSDSSGALSAWHSLAAAGDYTWHPRAEDTTGFLARFGRLFHGADGSAFAAAANAFDAACYPPEAPGFPALRPPRRSAAAERALTRLRRGARRNREALDLTAPAVDFLRMEETVRDACQAQVRALLRPGEDLPVALDGACNGELLHLNPLDGGSRLAIPAGEHRSHGVRLVVAPGPRNVVATLGERNPGGHRQVRIAVDATCDQLCFFHTAGYVRRGQELATYEVAWADGASERIAVLGQVQVGDWYKGAEALPAALPAWEGYLHPYSQVPLRLYLMPWANPRPQVPVAAVTLHSAGVTGHLSLVALTARTFHPDGIQAATRAPSLAAARRSIRAARRALLASHANCVVPEHLPLAERTLGFAQVQAVVDRLS